VPTNNDNIAYSWTYYSFSPKYLLAIASNAAGNRTAAANAIKQAKEALGMTKGTRALSNDDKAAIVQWHTARLTDDNQLDIEAIAPPVAIIEQAAPRRPPKATAKSTAPNKKTPINQPHKMVVRQKSTPR
jgi:hypothetical protein